MSSAACGAFILLEETSNSFEVASLDDEYALLGFALDGIRRVRNNVDTLDFEPALNLGTTFWVQVLGDDDRVPLGQERAIRILDVANF
eukprot:CAMPEP_0173083514 /NCGR_PEP_ID=MMETSP1102-20130122/19513_1 /TAXON_ID=49646 /ORGANISM="Geminigera sp., Strain Caron Lab Isolate" /LENGTH=87 /DNA_ID=CAMNT_0013960499 /DNA_START=124 /DNA_END=387 /DNA_ORIENTATION=+